MRSTSGWVAARHVVEDDDVVSAIAESSGGLGADVPSAPGDEDGHPGGGYGRGRI
jgi:hypothetical protein